MLGRASSGAKRALVACLLAATAFVATEARAADDPAEQASAAYRRGQAASARGAYLDAAKAFAEADSILANPVALESAIKAAILADEPALGMQLAERAHRGAAYAALTVVQEAFDKFRNRVGKIEVKCDSAALCEATVDGAPLPGNEGWFAIGAHQVALRAGERSFDQSVTVEGGGRAIVEMPPPAPQPVAAPLAKPKPAPPPPPEAERSTDAGAIVFWTGVGLTGAAAVGAFISLGDLVAKHGDFTASCTDVVGPAATCAELGASGESAQTRTWILGGVAMGLGVATAIVGATAVEWSDDGARTSASLRLIVRPGGVELEGTY